MDIRFENAMNVIDDEGKAIQEYVYADGVQVAHIRRSEFGPGFYVHIFGTKWQNAPGARYPQELDARTDYTYVKTRKAIEQIVKRVLEERNLAQRRESD